MRTDALTRASYLMERLLASMPGRVGAILTCMDEIKDAWQQQDRGQFPFNQLLDEVEAVAASSRSEYDDPEREVDRRSTLHEQLVSLHHRIRITIEFVVANKVFEGVERRFQRIDEVLPVKHYAVRELLPAIRAGGIEPPVLKKLDAALVAFDREQYRTVLRDCGEACELLFALFRKHLEGCGCPGMPREVGNALKNLRIWMTDPKSQDGAGLRFAVHARLEWLLLSMFESLHHLRNVGSHAPEVNNDRIPPWQCSRMAVFDQTPEHARLAIVLAFQLALELGALLASGEGQP